MKKAICIILVIICSCCLFARDRHVTSTAEGRQAEDLIQNGLYKNRDELLTLTPLLSSQERDLLYKSKKESPVKATLENAFLGFGIGSFSSGDAKGGWIQLGCELGGTVLGITSFSYLFAYGFVGFFDALAGKTDKDVEAILKASTAGFFLGAGAFIGGRIYGIVRGIKYPNQYNRDLQDTLYVSAVKPQLSLAPVFNPEGIGFGVGVKF